jgi:sec-independent protein translocase protein TatC
MEHIDELRSRLVRIFASLIIVTLFVFVFSIKKFITEGENPIEIYYPFPDPLHNIASQLISRVKGDLLPDYVQLIQTEPGQVIFAQLMVALFMGIIISMPFIVYQLSKFITPGLYEKERKIIRNVVAPASFLFIIGNVFSYFFITPFALNFLYLFGQELGVDLITITVIGLISFVILFGVAIGLSFQLPLIMIIVTSLGIVDLTFWKKNFSYAAVGIVIFGAAITPDGSGVTMWLVSVPMLALYGMGYLYLYQKFKVSAKSEDKQEPK